MSQTDEGRELFQIEGDSLHLGPDEIRKLEQSVVETLQTVYDPEIPVNIYELGLIYQIRVNAAAEVYVEMTLTSPACPVAGSLPPEVQNRIREIPGVSKAEVQVVWDPPWSMEKMSEAAKLQLGFL